jgi:hypothetical protein
VEAAKVNSGTAGGAAVVDYITIGGAVEVGSGAAGRVAMVELGLAVGRAAKVYSFGCGRSSRCRLATVK